MIINEPLYPYKEPLAWERELFQSRQVRRLKHLAHFGAGAFISPISHSRLEHTVGVWKLSAHFFPEDLVLRAAAILHDVGHLPFSHSVEKTLGFNHHELTTQLIQIQEISSILKKANINSVDIINFLNNPSILTGYKQTLGLDHLDSFLRDTYMAGTGDVLSREILPRLTCTTKGVETDKESGLYLMQLIKRDHELFLDPVMVGIDRLLAEAIKHHWNESSSSKSGFTDLTDSDVLNMLKSSPSSEAREIIDTILYEPSRIQIVHSGNGMGYPITMRKVYDKSPLFAGELLIHHCQQAKEIYASLSELVFEKEVCM
ncbi:HD domain-containing protein [Sutcliffiella rhizosphaerae]|uniref:HD/PDEase domain-containing protein n=1 Tax=Sutcliffiella rhizosphaerae TaxID=2880967 RepID=A0ABM8YJV0_9BACI|nr:HD domain-containing protein [Sutcliffiella rhizosphaerae]CAG9620174.1 hypothetical protein BACCIP111883_00942 [Sutcliffiella rhizosphaerae]